MMKHSPGLSDRINIIIQKYGPNLSVRKWKLIFDEQILTG